MANPTVAQKVPFELTPRDVDGNPVDLSAFPAALTEVSWVATDGDVEVVDQLHVFLSRATPGAASVTVTGKNVNGDVVSGSASVTFDAVTPVVTTLDVVAGDPVAR